MSEVINPAPNNQPVAAERSFLNARNLRAAGAIVVAGLGLATYTEVTNNNRSIPVQAAQPLRATHETHARQPEIYTDGEIVQIAPGLTAEVVGNSVAFNYKQVHEYIKEHQQDHFTFIASIPGHPDKKIEFQIGPMAIGGAIDQDGRFHVFPDINGVSQLEVTHTVTKGWDEKTKNFDQDITKDTILIRDSALA
jgi:hypothetical protein